MNDRLIITDPHGSQHRLAKLGPVFGIRPAWTNQTNGYREPAIVNRQPLSFGGHRVGEEVEILGPAEPPEGADEALAGPLGEFEFVKVRCQTWYQEPEGMRWDHERECYRHHAGGMYTRDEECVLGLGKL